MPRVLILNAGSSSLKWRLLDAQTEAVDQEGEATWIGAETGRHASEFAAVLQDLREAQIGAVGHRVVHGGARFRDAVRIDPDVLRVLDELQTLAPVHNPAAVAGIVAAQAALPDIPHVAAFDTAFHADLPEAAA